MGERGWVAVASVTALLACLFTAAAAQSQGTLSQRRFLPIAPRAALIGGLAPTADTTVSGTVAVPDVNVPSGVTLRTVGATTIRSDGDVVLAGVLSSGGALTIEAAGDVTISGAIAPASGSTGDLTIRGRNITIVSGDPARTSVSANGHVTIAASGGAAGREAQQAGEGVIDVGGTVAAGSGAAGTHVHVTGQDTTGASGAAGSDVRLNAGVRIILRASASGGPGGAGGGVIVTGVPGCPGAALIATGGSGGDGGSVHLHSTFLTFLGSGTIRPGDGGAGGYATVVGADGSAPGCAGAGGTAVGGKGGDGGQATHLGAVLRQSDGARIEGGGGGRGGQAEASGGGGAAGALPGAPSGGQGGSFTLRGAAGGEGTYGAGGAGGAVFHYGGNGGAGADGCKVSPRQAGGRGGDGGFASLEPGQGGPGPTFGGSQQLAASGLLSNSGGNGGAGGPGSPAGGVGGDGGQYRVVGTPSSQQISGFRDGADGGVCPAVTVTPKVASSGTVREWRFSGFQPGEQIRVVITVLPDHTEPFEVGPFTADANGSYTTTPVTTTNRTKELRLTATGLTSGKVATFDFTSTVP